MVHLPFADRLEAGRLLAAELARRKLASDAVILALTRGGVAVGFAVADRLRLPLDPIVVRKLGVPWQPELAMGAIAGTVRILDDPMIEQLGISNGEVEEIIEREQEEIRRREALYRGDKPPLPLRGKSVVLVDDGLATGSTMLAAVRHVRSLGAARVIVGVPVGSKEACNRLRKEVDDIVCLAVPDRFCAVGEWYLNFEQVNDEAVRSCLAESGRQLRKHLASQSVA